MFSADNKKAEPILAGPGPKDEADYRKFAERQNTARMRHQNEQEAKFHERFLPRLVDLQIDLKRLGANERVTSMPLWATFNWPDSFLRDVGTEIVRLGTLYATEE